jgi:hypothetical protein
MRRVALIAALVVFAAGCGDDSSKNPSAAVTSAPASTAVIPTTVAPTTTIAKTSTVPPGPRLSPEKVREFGALFDDQPYTGGQTAPRLSKWINENTYVFVQFDKFPVAEATAVRYVGIGVKGVFCTEAQPDASAKSFTHFHRPVATQYAEGHGGPPGTQGYWLTWMATASFDSQGRAVQPGIDYQFSPTPPPPCGGAVPTADFAAPGQKTLSKEDLAKFVAFFNDQVLIGGQTPPRLSRWLNEDVALFIQLDKPNPAEATTIRYVGIYKRGVFCKSTQPHPDFTHYHRYSAAQYAEGHGGPPGETGGYWLAWMATETFESQGRTVQPGIDRQFSPTPAPDC